MLTINAIRQTARGTPIWQPGAINLHVSVPCPLKVRLKGALGAFIDDYNQRHERPLFCPSILDGIPHGIDDLMQSSDNAQELPDIWVSTGLHTAFSQPFKQRFIDRNPKGHIWSPRWMQGQNPDCCVVAKWFFMGRYIMPPCLVMRLATDD